MRTFAILTLALMAGPALAQDGGSGGFERGGGGSSGGGSVRFSTGGGTDAASGTSRIVADPDGGAAIDGVRRRMPDPGVITDVSEVPPDASEDGLADRGAGSVIRAPVTDRGVLTDISEVPPDAGEDGLADRRAGSVIRGQMTDPGRITDFSELPPDAGRDGLRDGDGFAIGEPIAGPGFITGASELPSEPGADGLTGAAVADGLGDDDGLATGIGRPAGAEAGSMVIGTDRPAAAPGNGGQRGSGDILGGEGGGNVNPRWVRPPPG